MSTAARLNALIAVEDDAVRRHGLLADRRLAAAVTLARRVEVCEALLAHHAVPAARLDPAWVAALRLSGEVVLDDDLALRVVARGPLTASHDAVRSAA